MPKLISVTQKAFDKIIALASKKGATRLVEEITQNLAPGASYVKDSAQDAAAKKGRVLLGRNEFKNLVRAASVGGPKGRVMMKPQESFQNEIRSSRGKSPFKKKVTGPHSSETFMPHGRRVSGMEPKRIRRSEEEELLAWLRAQDRDAARTGRRLTKEDAWERYN